MIGGGKPVDICPSSADGAANRNPSFEEEHSSFPPPTAHSPDDTKPKGEEDEGATGTSGEKNDGNGADICDDDDDDDSSSSSRSSSDEEDEDKKRPLVMGGNIETPAFALLVGRVEDPNDSSNKDKISVPLTRLPATIGRTHKNSDGNFFGLGMHKTLSRAHCAIYYRDAGGGRLGQYKADSDELVYRPREKAKDADSEKKKEKGGKEEKDNKVLRPIRCSASIEMNDDGNHDHSDDIERLPASGFFVIECLGKNKIIVGGRKVDQGQVALLESGTPIKLGSYSLYFLLPNELSGEKGTTVRVPNPAYEAYQRKRARAVLEGGGGGGAPPSKRKKGEASAFASAPRLAIGGGPTSELEALPVTILLTRMSDAMHSGQWERKHQMIGSAISLHAVRDAARSAEMRKIAKKEGGVARGEVMRWIESSPVYLGWVSQMLGKMELKSYQSNISKALVKAGYMRTGTTGRHVRWTLPEDVSPEDDHEYSKGSGEDSSKDGSKDSSSESNGEDDDDDGSDDESDDDGDIKKEDDSSEGKGEKESGRDDPDGDSGSDDAGVGDEENDESEGESD